MVGTALGLPAKPWDSPGIPRANHNERLIIPKHGCSTPWQKFTDAGQSPPPDMPTVPYSARSLLFWAVDQ